MVKIPTPWKYVSKLNPSHGALAETNRGSRLDAPRFSSEDAEVVCHLHGCLHMQLPNSSPSEQVQPAGFCKGELKSKKPAAHKQSSNRQRAFRCQVLNRRRSEIQLGTI